MSLRLAIKRSLESVEQPPAPAPSSAALPHQDQRPFSSDNGAASSSSNNTTNNNNSDEPINIAHLLKLYKKKTKHQKPKPIVTLPKITKYISNSDPMKIDEYGFVELSNALPQELLREIHAEAVRKVERSSHPHSRRMRKNNANNKNNDEKKNNKNNGNEAASLMTSSSPSPSKGGGGGGAADVTSSSIRIRISINNNNNNEASPSPPSLPSPSKKQKKNQHNQHHQSSSSPSAPPQAPPSTTPSASSSSSAAAASAQSAYPVVEEVEEISNALQTEPSPELIARLTQSMERCDVARRAMIAVFGQTKKKQQQHQLQQNHNPNQKKRQQQLQQHDDDSNQDYEPQHHHHHPPPSVTSSSSDNDTTSSSSNGSNSNDYQKKISDSSNTSSNSSSSHHCIGGTTTAATANTNNTNSNNAIISDEGDNDDILQLETPPSSSTVLLEEEKSPSSISISSSSSNYNGFVVETPKVLITPPGSHPQLPHADDHCTSCIICLIHLCDGQEPTRVAAARYYVRNNNNESSPKKKKKKKDYPTGITVGCDACGREEQLPDEDFRRGVHLTNEKWHCNCHSPHKPYDFEGQLTSSFSELLEENAPNLCDAYAGSKKTHDGLRSAGDGILGLPTLIHRGPGNASASAESRYVLFFTLRPLYRNMKKCEGDGMMDDKQLQYHRYNPMLQIHASCILYNQFKKVKSIYENSGCNLDGFVRSIVGLETASLTKEVAKLKEENKILRKDLRKVVKKLKYLPEKDR